MSRSPSQLTTRRVARSHDADDPDNSALRRLLRLLIIAALCLLVYSVRQQSGSAAAFIDGAASQANPLYFSLMERGDEASTASGDGSEPHAFNLDLQKHLPVVGPRVRPSRLA